MAETDAMVSKKTCMYFDSLNLVVVSKTLLYFFSEMVADTNNYNQLCQLANGEYKHLFI